MKRSRLARKTGLRRSKLVASAIGKARRAVERKLDDLCRKLVVLRRDQNTCQRCGKRGEDGHRIEWCHVRKRNAKSIQWTPWNTLGLCGPRLNSTSCHHWFDTHPTEAVAWWAEKWPERALQLEAWRHEKKHRVDYAIEEMWLRQQLRDGPT